MVRTVGVLLCVPGVTARIIGALALDRLSSGLVLHPFYEFPPCTDRTFKVVATVTFDGIVIGFPMT